MGEIKEAKATLIGGMKFEGWAGSGHTVMMDAEEVHGGEDAGFRPMELLLVGLAGCTAMDVISILRKKRQDVTGLEVRVRGERADEHPKVYKNIEIEYIVTGHDVEEKAVARAIELSTDKYCGATATLRHTAEIKISYKIVDGD